MRISERLKLELPGPPDLVDVEVLTRNFEKLEADTAEVRTGAFSFDALAETLQGGSLTVKKSGTEAQPVYIETLTKGSDTIATRKTTRLTDGGIVVNIVAEPYGINVSKKYTKSADGTYTGVTN